MKKVVIYSNPEDLSQGLFGQILTWVLEILPLLEHDGYGPEDVNWDVQTLHYGAVIPEIIVPRHPNSESGAHWKMNLVEVKHNLGYRFTPDDAGFRYAHEIFYRWFKFSESVHKLIPLWHQSEKVLGLHYRGTDKVQDEFETNPLYGREFLLVVEEILELEFDRVFVCSDESGFVADVGAKIKGTPVCEISQPRSADSVPYFFKSETRTWPENHAHAEYAIADALALSKCSAVIKCQSALSAWAKIFNPDCDIKQVSASRQSWFPAAAIELYTPRSEITRGILKNTLSGHRGNVGSELPLV